ncbi:MAG: T9SS type A sorting domain-containing protein [Saprospiraceae bacterium]
MKQSYISFIVIFLFSTLGFAKRPNFGSPACACDAVADSLELVKIYQTFNGFGWVNKSNWRVPGMPISTWFGVTTDVDGCVTELRLPGNSLNGVIYDINLPNLTTLDLSHNAIAGTIPDFSHLPLLVNLVLEYNALSGAIPNFSGVPNLDILFLQENRLSGQVPDFSNLPNLSFLWLDHNDLTGPIPDFSNFPSMVNLLINFTKISGQIPNFSNMPVAEDVELLINQLSGPIPDFDKMPNLKFLYLVFNELSGPLPNFSQVPLMEQLELSFNQLSGTIPDFLEMPNLTHLQLGYNRFTGPAPDLPGKPNMDVLNLAGNQLEGQIPDYVSIYPVLSQLWLDNNLFSGAIPFIPNNIFYTLHHNNYTFSDLINSPTVFSDPFSYDEQNLFYRDTIIRIEKGQAAVIDLGIDASLNNSVYTWKKDSLSFTLPPGNNPNSNKLIFNNPTAANAGRYTASVTNPAMPGLTLHSYTISLEVCDKQLDSLELVKLYNSTNGPNWVNHTNWLVPGQPISTWFGVIPDAFGCVQKLDLNSNQLAGAIPTLQMNALEGLNLESNALIGTIPEFGTPFIQELNLSRNSLNGGFPNELKNWRELRRLELGNNNIAGTIPPILGDLCMLEALSVNNNQITGELPEQLTMLYNLQAGQVDFSNNQIDSLKNKIIFFCPFGDTILSNNPSSNRFLGICNVQCTGVSWDVVFQSAWFQNILDGLSCDNGNCFNKIVEAGFVQVRGVPVVFTLDRCYQGFSYVETINFFDCAGNLLETADCDQNGNCFGQRVLTVSELLNLNYDVRWSCSQNNASSSVYEALPGSPSFSIGALKLYCSPNPTSDFVVCTADDFLSSSSLQVHDLSGRRQAVPVKPLENGLELDMRLLPAGLYMVSVLGEKGRYVGRIVLR